MNIEKKKMQKFDRKLTEIIIEMQKTLRTDSILNEFVLQNKILCFLGKTVFFIKIVNKKRKKKELTVSTKDAVVCTDILWHQTGCTDILWHHEIFIYF